jgi:mycothiol synthase
MMRSALRIDTYNNGDEADILDIWREALPQDAIDVETFAQKVLADPNYERGGMLVARQDGRAVGFALALVRRIPIDPASDLDPDTAWIAAFAVRPEARRAGVGASLFDAAEAFARARGRRRLEVGPYAPNYFWPGTDPERYPQAVAFLETRGYGRIYDCVAMDKSLVGYATPPDVLALERSLEAEGYHFTTLSPRYVVALAEFNDRVFNPDWARACRDAVARRVPWDRTLLCVKDDEVCGFAQIGAYDHVPDRFGPFGVDESLRGKGIGKVLLYRSMAALAQKGYHDTWFLWTGERSPAGHLYRRAGFTVTRSFVIYGLRLDGGQG